MSFWSSLHCITTRAEINAVYVKLENLLFRKFAFDAQRDHCFQQFPAERAATERKTVARQLHCETARAFLCGHAENVPRQSAQNPAPIDAFVLVESTVLACQHRHDEIL